MKAKHLEEADWKINIESTTDRERKCNKQREVKKKHVVRSKNIGNTSGFHVVLQSLSAWSAGHQTRLST